MADQNVLPNMRIAMAIDPVAGRRLQATTVSEAEIVAATSKAKKMGGNCMWANLLTPRGWKKDQSRKQIKKGAILEANQARTFHYNGEA